MTSLVTRTTVLLLSRILYSSQLKKYVLSQPKPLKYFARVVNSGLHSMVYSHRAKMQAEAKRSRNTTNINQNVRFRFLAMWMGLMAYFHQRIRTRIRIPNPIVTLYYAQLFQLVQIQIRIPVQIVSWMDYCTHFRDGSPFQGQISVPISYIWIRGSKSESEPVEKSCIVQESESESVSGSGNMATKGCLHWTIVITSMRSEWHWKLSE